MDTSRAPDFDLGSSKDRHVVLHTAPRQGAGVPDAPYTHRVLWVRVLGPDGNDHLRQEIQSLEDQGYEVGLVMFQTGGDPSDVTATFKRACRYCISNQEITMAGCTLGADRTSGFQDLVWKA